MLELREKLRKMYRSVHEHTDGEVKHQKDIYDRHLSQEHIRQDNLFGCNVISKSEKGYL